MFVRNLLNVLSNVVESHIFNYLVSKNSSVCVTFSKKFRIACQLVANQELPEHQRIMQEVVYKRIGSCCFLSCYVV